MHAPHSCTSAVREATALSFKRRCSRISPATLAGMPGKGYPRSQDDLQVLQTVYTSKYYLLLAGRVWVLANSCIKPEARRKAGETGRALKSIMSNFQHFL